ncbi:MAG: DUF5706 domain-containing protein [Thaumarchaeota archaeon]|nr:DUF5706 domain-containing protein [Nitrososphaerota archaeon]
MNEDLNSKKIDFAKNILEQNSNLIRLIDTKAGLILGSAGIILGLLSFFDHSLVAKNTEYALFATVTFLGATMIFSFLTIFPRTTSKAKTETAIFYESIIQQTEEEYSKTIDILTCEKIIADYARNIHSLARVQKRKFSTLRMSLVLMMISVGSLMVTLYCYFA